MDRQVNFQTALWVICGWMMIGGAIAGILGGEAFVPLGMICGIIAVIWVCGK